MKNSKSSKLSSLNKIHKTSMFNKFKALVGCSALIYGNNCNNKRCLSADGLSLLPSALRPRLLERSGDSCHSHHSSFINIINTKVSLSKLIVIMSMLLISPLLCCAMFNINNVSAASLTLTVPDTPISLDLTPTQEGSFAKSNASTVSVKTDAFAGYTLTIASKDSSSSDSGNSLVNRVNEEHKLLSIPSSITEEEFKSNSQYNNMWGYMPSKLDSNDNSNYIAGPTINATTIDKTTSANNNNPNNYNFTLAAKVDNTLAYGTYTNSFTLTVTANTVNYSISYELNSGSGESLPNPQTGSTVENKVKLSNVTPTRAGFEFKGWCSNPTSNESCSGTIYQPDSDYPLTADNNNVALYAMWKSTIPTTMQDFGDYCSSMTEHQVITLTDTRDNNQYKVSKLKDGKCWMVENLRISGRILTSADSDVSSQFVLPSSSTDGFSDYNVANVYVSSTWGGYYNWYAVTAGTGNTSLSGSGVNAKSSICPKGWRLPNNSLNEFQILWDKYGGTLESLLVTPPNGPGFTLPGYYSGGRLVDESNEGDYWTSTTGVPSRTYGAYIMNLERSGSSISYNTGQYYGDSARCIAR